VAWELPLKQQAIFFHMVRLANFKDTTWASPRGELIDIPRGAFITSVAHLMDYTGATEESVRWAITKLSRLLLIHPMESPTGNPTQFTFISIVDYDSYQGHDPESPTVSPMVNPGGAPQEPQQRKTLRPKVAREDMQDKSAVGVGKVIPESAVPLQDLFSALVARYPKEGTRQAAPWARKHFDRIMLSAPDQEARDALMGTMLNSLEEQAQWISASGKHAPSLSTWLQGRFFDPVMPYRDGRGRDIMDLEDFTEHLRNWRKEAH
jgi:hypothetical protein